jgi:hypothetical protein
MTDFAIHAARNAFAEAARMLLLPAAAAIFLSLTEAFGLQSLSLGSRLLYWLALLGIGQSGSLLVRASLDRLQLAPAGLFLAATVRCVLVALPITVAVWLVTSALLLQPLRAERLPVYFLYVLLVTAAMVVINVLAQRRPVETHAESPDPSKRAAAPAILARLPPRMRAAKLYAVQAEDHYIRFHTSAGSDLVLLRFSDALTELRGLDGAQVHRSWWVARDAVETSNREDGKLFLMLHGGTRAPVSRTFTRALRKAGWL